MPFPPQVKEDALVACGRHCCLCHKFCGPNMEIHHITQAADGGPDIFDNAIPLCFDCHAEVRAYNPRHPRGAKYTESELRRHRDKWYAKVDNSTGITLDNEFRQLDIKTYYKLKEYLPEDEMQALYNAHFETPTNKDRITALYDFPYFSNNPVYEYIDADIESMKVSLAKSLLKFSNESSHYLHIEGSYLRIPLWMKDMDSETYSSAVEIVRSDIDSIWHAYCDYVRISRRKLLIEGQLATDNWRCA